MKQHRSRLVHVFIAAILVASCGGATTTGIDASSNQPWTKQFTFGNFSVNTKDIVTNQDGVSANILTDYITTAVLPATNLELFIVNAYIPAGTGMTSRISNGNIRIRRADNTQTPNFFKSADFIQQSTIGGQAYDVHRIQGIFLGSPAVTPATFTNVNFVFNVDYVTATGSIANSTQKTIEITKR